MSFAAAIAASSEAHCGWKGGDQNSEPAKRAKRAPFFGALSQGASSIVRARVTCTVTFFDTRLGSPAPQHPAAYAAREKQVKVSLKIVGRQPENVPQRHVHCDRMGMLSSLQMC